MTAAKKKTTTATIPPEKVIEYAKEGRFCVSAGKLHAKDRGGVGVEIPGLRYHGMLFRPEMSRAIAKGLKKQTRRAPTSHNASVDGHPTSPRTMASLDLGSERVYVDPGPSPMGNPGPYLHVPHVDAAEGTVHRLYPRVWPGDVLWARETWRPDPLDPYKTRFFSTAIPLKGERWRTPLHLPQDRARFLLVVTEPVRPVRLGEIDDADCLAEGVEPTPGQSPRDAFLALWARVHGEGAWERDKSRWVWRFCFERIDERPI